jgi:hypothetical protein
MQWKSSATDTSNTTSKTADAAKCLQLILEHIDEHDICNSEMLSFVNNSDWELELAAMSRV